MAAPKARWPVLKARYLEHLKVQNYAPRTIEGIEAHVRFFFEYLEKETKTGDLSELDYEDLAAYQTWLCYAPSAEKEAPLCVNTQHHRLWALQGFFGFLFKRGMILSDPSSALEKPRMRTGLPRNILKPAQVLSLLEMPATKTPLGLRDRTILETLYATGIRNEELITLILYGV